MSVKESTFLSYWRNLNKQLALLGRPNAIFPVAIACFEKLPAEDAARYIKAPYCPSDYKCAVCGTSNPNRHAVDCSDA